MPVWNFVTCSWGQAYISINRVIQRFIRLPVPTRNILPPALSCIPICIITSPIISPLGGSAHSSKMILLSSREMNLECSNSVSMTIRENSSAETWNESRCCLALLGIGSLFANRPEGIEDRLVSRSVYFS